MSLQHTSQSLGKALVLTLFPHDLDPRVTEVSRPFVERAMQIATTMPDNEARAEALNALVKARSEAVRALDGDGT